MPLTLRADAANIGKWWWVDGAHAVHPNMHGHSGGCSTLSRGVLIASLSKQKLNARSSTETELITADDFMPQILWTNHFLDAQDCESSDTVLCQDDKSTVLLAMNGTKSSGKRTKHIECRFYFVADCTNAGAFCIQCCPAEEMTADFFTKPLQGALFCKFCSVVVNLPDKDED